MKTQNKIIFSAVLALLFVTNVYGTSTGYDATGGRLADKMKFGVGIGRGFIEGSPFLAESPAGTYTFLDLFGEYKFSDEYGLRLSIQPTSSSLVQASDQSLHVGYCNVGLTHRVYVGQDKQLCLFFGVETSILTSAKKKRKDYLGKNVELDLRKKEDLEKITYNSKSKLNEVRSRFKIGWDYECENGLIIGGIFTSTWASEDKENDDKNSVYVLPASTQQLFYLGYNFAKLFE